MTKLKLCLAALLIIVSLVLASILRAQPPHYKTPPPQCVKVLVVDKDGRSGGTGALIGKQLVITAHHVVKDRKSSKCEILFPNWACVSAHVLSVDKKLDLALIILDKPSDVTPLTMSHQKQWEPGDQFAIMGYGYAPFVCAWGTLDKSGWGAWKQILGAQARSGDSGGPVLDSSGRYAGTLWGSDKEGTMFTPVDKVAEFINLNILRTPMLPVPDQIILYQEEKP